VLAATLVVAAFPALAQSDDVAAQLKALQQAQADLEHQFDALAKAIDDIAWFQRVGDVAVVDKWRIVGPPDANPKNPDAPGATNPIKFYTYTFVPKSRAPGEKLPMLVLPHGGVHADFTTYHAHIVRELIEQGYVVVAPGLSRLDRLRQGLLPADRLRRPGGRGHAGGQGVRARHLRLRRPRARRADRLEPRRPDRADGELRPPARLRLRVRRRAGVRPRDADGLPRPGLPRAVQRDYHIGKTVRQDIADNKRRSPVWNVDKLDVPLLIHTSTNDEDVNVIEVEHLIQALKAANKKFEYKVFDDAPGGHSFDAWTCRRRGRRGPKIWAFLARHLKPAPPAALTDRELRSPQHLRPGE